MKKETTYKQLIAFVNLSNVLVERGKEKETKLTASLKSVLKQIRKEEILEDYNEKLNEISLDNCSVDDKGIILKDDKGNLKFTPEKQKLVNKKTMELLKETVSIHTRILEDNKALTKDLSDYDQETLSGLVIPEIED